MQRNGLDPSDPYNELVRMLAQRQSAGDSRVAYLPPKSLGEFYPVDEGGWQGRPEVPGAENKWADRNPQISFELGRRITLFAKAFGQVRTNGFAGPPQLIGQPVLFNLGKQQTDAMDFERYPIRPLEDVQLFKRSDGFALSVLCHLSSVP